jgi:glucuronosyltransferase
LLFSSGNLSGVLINSDYVLDYPRPLPPTFINIGGLQIKAAPAALPEPLRRFLDEASAGAILFTMGFIFSPDTVPPERVQTFLTAFR